MRNLRKVKLGNTGIEVTKMSFGALPVQRCDTESGVKLLRTAYEEGINYFDTAALYTDSETKIGLALSDVRENIIISTKSMHDDLDGMKRDLENSLRAMKTDYVDIWQLHNPKEAPLTEDDPRMQLMLEAKRQGMIKHIGITNHSIIMAMKAAKSGLYETMQFPYSYLSGEPEEELVRYCEENGIGFIAMKGLCGGLITNAKAAWVFMQDKYAVPIWGIQRPEELYEFLTYEDEQPVMTEELMAVIEADRKELAGNFCRGCGYCMPCPANIPINNAARMAFLLRRSPYQQYMTPEWKEKMERIEDCKHCGACAKRCPYGINAETLLPIMLKDYKEFSKEHGYE